MIFYLKKYQNLAALIVSALSVFTISCTTEKVQAPTYRKYLEDTNLMLNIAKKFTSEPNAKKLNKVAVATEQARVISCANFNGECDLYGKFISTTIEFTQDGILTSEEREKLELLLNQLAQATKEGLAKLRLQKI